MIKGFRHKGLKRLYDRRGVAPEMADKIERILARLDIAKAPGQMDLPGLRLHPLKGQMRGFWSRVGERQLANRIPFSRKRRHRR